MSFLNNDVRELGDFQRSIAASETRKGWRWMEVEEQQQQQQQQTSKSPAA
jgi:hypothetical protein